MLQMATQNAKAKMRRIFLKCRGELEEYEDNWESIGLEQDIIMPLSGSQGSIYVYHSNRMWSQVKTASSAIYANRQYLALYRKRQPSRLADDIGPRIIGDVYIHATAQVHPTCVVSDQMYCIHNMFHNLKNICSTLPW